MSATSFLMVMAMLALVLGAMGIALRVLRRYAVTNASASGGVKMQVIQRLSLGQRQGLAVVRIGTRVLAVSMGDGGVHQVAELIEDDLASAAGTTGATGAAPIHAIANSIRKLVLVRGNDDDRDVSAATARHGKSEVTRIPYVAPLEDFQTVLSMALGGGAQA
jgi:flagellar biogenesis protein FliO